MFYLSVISKNVPFLRINHTIRQLTTTELNSLHLQSDTFFAEFVNTIRCQSTAAPMRSTSRVRVMDALGKECACSLDVTATHVVMLAALLL